PDTSQRAMVAGRIANMKRGGDRRSENFKGSIDPLKPQDCDSIISKEKAASLLNVSEPTVRRAKRVLREGSEELVKAVEAGTVSVLAAYYLATPPQVSRRRPGAAPRSRAQGRGQSRG